MIIRVGAVASLVSLGTSVTAACPTTMSLGPAVAVSASVWWRAAVTTTRSAYLTLAFASARRMWRARIVTSEWLLPSAFPLPSVVTLSPRTLAGASLASTACMWMTLLAAWLASAMDIHQNVKVLGATRRNSLSQTSSLVSASHIICWSFES